MSIKPGFFISLCTVLITLIIICTIYIVTAVHNWGRIIEYSKELAIEKRNVESYRSDWNVLYLANRDQLQQIKFLEGFISCINVSSIDKASLTATLKELRLIAKSFPEKVEPYNAKKVIENTPLSVLNQGKK